MIRSRSLFAAMQRRHWPRAVFNGGLLRRGRSQRCAAPSDRPPRPLIPRRRIEEIRASLADEPEQTQNTNADRDQIAPRILSIVQIPRESPLFKALSKKSLYTWPISVYQSVLSDLNELLAACVSLKFAPESGYIGHIALDVKNERAERLAVRTMSLADIAELLSRRMELLERRSQKFVSPILHRVGVSGLTPDGPTARKSSNAARGPRHRRWS
jgi:hypothetical protein